MASTIPSASPVTVSYIDLVNTPNKLVDSINRAFGSDPDCLGILIVTDLPKEYPALRLRLLLLANKFAALDEAVRETYSDPKSHYSFGWSWGKEIMNGVPDVLKGSYYANPVVDSPEVSIELKNQFPEVYGDNIWPTSSELAVAGFEDAFKELGQFVFAVGLHVAFACQPFVSTHIRDNAPTLTSMISRSRTLKARLLHYFPPSQLLPDSLASLGEDENESIDSWCGFHKDHSMLTGLCSAAYVLHERESVKVVPSPSPSSGLYIRTRGGDLRKVVIPVDALAFQTGEALEVATDGSLRATPHCVRVGQGNDKSAIISRETFALFMAPDVDQPLSDTETYGSFSKRIIESHYTLENSKEQS